MDVKKIIREFRTKRAFRHVDYVFIKTLGTYVECDIRIEGPAERAIKIVERMADKHHLELIGNLSRDMWRFRGREGHRKLVEYEANLEKLKAELESYSVEVILK